MTRDFTVQEDAHHLGQKLFGKKSKKGSAFSNKLMDMYNMAQDKDFLLIHNPGGWGSNSLEHIQEWERSILDGIKDILEKDGYSSLLIQWFRTGNNWWELITDVKEQIRFFATKAKVMATSLEFITRHISNLKVILIGISQGAAFTNATMQSLNNSGEIYSIEIGMFSMRRSRRVVTPKMLVIDGNGVVPDATLEWNLIDMSRAFSAAPFRWIKCRLQGKPLPFSYCINSPGHDYYWSYPKVQQQIGNFLTTNFNSNIG